jgi:hypothetical protein
MVMQKKLAMSFNTTAIALRQLMYTDHSNFGSCLFLLTNVGILAKELVGSSPCSRDLQEAKFAVIQHELASRRTCKMEGKLMKIFALLDDLEPRAY